MFFIKLIKSRGRLARYIKFLIMVCECNGGPIPQNQDRVQLELLLNNACLLYQTKMKNGIPVIFYNIKWISVNMFFKVAKSSDVEYLEQCLLLFSALAIGRNTKAINIITSKFINTEQILQLLRDDNIEYRVKYIYARLAIHLLIDIDPHILRRASINIYPLSTIGRRSSTRKSPHSSTTNLIKLVESKLIKEMPTNHYTTLPAISNYTSAVIFQLTF